MLRQALANSAWLFSDRLYRMCTAMVAGVLVARYLGPDRFGWLNFAAAAVALLTSFTEMGINTVVVRDLVQSPDALRELMGTGMLLRGAGAGLAFLVCLIVGLTGMVPERTEGPLIAVFGLGLLFQVSDLFDLLLQASGAQRITAWIQTAANTVSTLVKLALIALAAPVVAFAAATVFETSLCALGRLLVGRTRGWHVTSWRPRLRRARVLLGESWPLAVSGLAVYAQGYTDQLVVGSMLGGSDLGQYAAAMRLVNVFSFLPLVVQSVAAPEITRAKVAGEAVYMRRLHDLYRLMMVLFVGVAVPLALLGPEVVRLLYGHAYLGACALLPWLALRLFFTNFGVARAIFIANDSLFRFALLTAVAGGITSIVLNLSLVPRWGIIGAIIASLLSFAVSTFALDFFQRRARGNLRLMARAVVMPWRALPAAGAVA